MVALLVGVGVEPACQVVLQGDKVAGKVVCRQQRHGLAQQHRQALDVGTKQGNKTLLNAGAAALFAQFSQRSG